MSAMIVKLRKLGGIGKKAGVDLELPDGLEDVTALRKLVADKLGLEGKRLRLSHKGRVLHDFGINFGTHFGHHCCRHKP